MRVACKSDGYLLCSRPVEDRRAGLTSFIDDPQCYPVIYCGPA